MAHDITHVLRRDAPKPDPVRPAGGAWILHCNAPEAAYVLRRYLELSEAPMYRVGYWAWELPEAPAEWLEIASCFHEIWTPTTFAAGAFTHAPVQTRVMPHTLTPSSVHRVQPKVKPAYFLTFADLRSTAARKNPLGSVKAYLQAFPEPGAARLTVKLSAVHADRQTFRWLQALVRHRPDVTVMTQTLSDQEVAQLTAAADVLISLHRSEGFGLTVAEAMAEGKAVVATSWSGNLDYMNGTCADQLVPYHLTPVRDPAGIYSGEQHWAEPDLDSAAELIRRLARDRDLRVHLGALNRAAIDRLAEPWRPDQLGRQPFAKWVANISSPTVPGAELGVGRARA